MERGDLLLALGQHPAVVAAAGKGYALIGAGLAGGLAVLGMTDVAQTRGGKLVNLTFRKPGKVIPQGRSAATIESAKWVGPFPMPFEGEIVESFKSGMYRIALDNGHETLGYTAGKMRKYRIKILPGDRIKVELSPYDLDRGRITYRYK